MAKTKCQNCGKVTSRFKPLEEVKDLLQRIAPGEIFPAGECLTCGALVHLKTAVFRADLAKTACELLEIAYLRGERAEHMDWNDVDEAYRVALKALGRKA
jgi:hypothetical protein